MLATRPAVQNGGYTRAGANRASYRVSSGSWPGRAWRSGT